MSKPRLLAVLHRSPPSHGAAKVGDFISQSKKLQDEFECKFITIKSSQTISEIGKINLKKFYLVFELYIKVALALIFFRPNKIYFTSSIHGVAFYRDLLISTLYKIYSKLKEVDIYYHYHTKGVDNFVSNSLRNFKLTKFFVKGVNIILLSPTLKSDFQKVDGYKSISYLPNGVEDNFNEDSFKSYIENKDFDQINILYLSNMIKSKGYFEVLKLAKGVNKYHFHFAGGWQSDEDKDEFFEFIKSNNLEEVVTFHGFINGDEKRKLFESSQLFIFPTRYENEAFPLSILEAFSYGLAVISTDEASIPSIVDDKTSVLIKEMSDLDKALDDAIKTFINIDTAYECRNRYLKYFSLDRFEENLVKVFQWKF